MTKQANIEEPQTDAEWQAAVDEAEAWLMIHLTIKHGLVEYSGKINAVRCREILERGQKKHIHPSPEALDELLTRLKACYDFKATPELSTGDRLINRIESQGQ